MSELESVWFAIVVDGEVAWLHSVDKRLEGMVAAFQSDPKVIEIPLDVLPEIASTSGTSWTYEDGKFTPPKE